MQWRRQGVDRILCLTALLVASIATGRPVRAGERPVLAVLKFQDETGAMPLLGGAGRALSNMLANELATRAAFTVVERRKLADVLEQQDLSRSGLVEPSERVRIGELTGAQFLVMGTISAFDDNTRTTVARGAFRRATVESLSTGATFAIDLRVVDASSGEVRYARTVEGRSAASRVDLSKRDGGLRAIDRPGDSVAMRDAAVAIGDYLECAMVVRDECLRRYAEQDRLRVERTRAQRHQDSDRP